jgi:hydroxypyruvate isomerase
VSIRQSVCLPILPLDSVDLSELLLQIAEIGYPAVEIWRVDDTFETLCKDAERHGLRVVSMLGHEAKPGGLNDRASHDRIEEELKHSIELGADHGLNGVICFSGDRLHGLSDAAAIEITAEGLKRAAPYAEARGIDLNLELLNSRVDHKGYQCDHTSWGLEVVKLVDSPRVKLLYDIYHMQIMEGDIIRTLVENIDAIGHIHTAGNPGRHDLDDEQEINYRGVCRAVSASTYSGYVGHEFRPKGDVIEALRQAFEVCDR